MAKINTHNLIITFGKHRGELWTRVPRDYLTWLVNQPPLNGDDTNIKIALAELKRRGTVPKTDLELSGHAIDRASLRCRKLWHETALNPEEGIYSWLTRVANEALANAPENAEEIIYNNLKFVFKRGTFYPILKSVMPKK